MPTTTSDTLTVRATASDDAHADKANLFVTIRGSSLVTGSAAIKKAREVRQLVADLAAVGVAEEAITLLAVKAEAATNALGKSSSASYSLRIRCTQLDDLADVLGVITSQKNVQLTHMAWDYPDLAAMHNRLLAESLGRAATKAQIMATTLASRIERVHTVAETGADQEDTTHPQFALTMASPELHRARVSADDFGLALTHTKQIRVQVEVTYHIQPA